MTNVEVDVASTVGSLTDGQKGFRDAADEVNNATVSSSDPRIKTALKALHTNLKEDLDDSDDKSGKAKDGAEKTEDLDRKSATDVGGTPAGAPGNSGGGGPVASTSGAGGGNTPQPRQTLSPQNWSGGQQMNAPQPVQQPMMQQPMFSPQAMTTPIASAAPAVMNTASSYPAGTVMVDRTKLASLISSVNGSSGGGGGGSSPVSSSAPNWNGDTRPSPIDVGQVEYNKTHGQLSQAETSAVIDSAMDKTGIEDPAARAKWKPVLEFMSHHESTNNPSSVNMSDSNAVGPTQSDGAPSQSSRGQWQTIPTTFAANHAAGTSNNIYDPEASAGAAINYIKSRYNVGPNGDGLDAFAASRGAGGYTGY